MRFIRSAMAGARKRHQVRRNENYFQLICKVIGLILSFAKVGGAAAPCLGHCPVGNGGWERGWYGYE